MENKKLSFKATVALSFLVYFFSYAMRLDYAASAGTVFVYLSVPIILKLSV